MQVILQVFQTFRTKSEIQDLKAGHRPRKEKNAEERGKGTGEKSWDETALFGWGGKRPYEASCSPEAH